MNQNEDRSQDTSAFDRRLMGSVVRLPMVVNKAMDSCILDAMTDRSLLDFWGDEGVCSLGYNTPEVKNAICDFFDGNHPHQLPDVYPNTIRWEAAEVICQAVGMDRIFFANSGAEANEAAIKIARKYWWDMEAESTKVKRRIHGHPYSDRHLILTLEGNFHGRTGLSLAASDNRVSRYHRWGFGPVARGFGVISSDFKLVVIDGIELPKPIEVPWERVAAVILAPVLGNNLVKTYSGEFWHSLAMEREKHGFLVIHDDIQAGSGRAGWAATYRGLHAIHGLPIELVKPNIITLGKGMAMGFPMSAMLTSESIARSFTPGVHFNTFGGSPFVCHMATRLFKWLAENNSAVLLKGTAIREFFKRQSWVADCDGMGMLNAFLPEFHRYGYDGFQYCHRARQFGLSLVTHRQYGPIRFTPPLNIEQDELKKAFQAVKDTHESLVS